MHATCNFKNLLDIGCDSHFVCKSMLCAIKKSLKEGLVAISFNLRGEDSQMKCLFCEFFIAHSIHSHYKRAGNNCGNYHLFSQQYNDQDAVSVQATVL